MAFVVTKTLVKVRYEVVNLELFDHFRLIICQSKEHIIQQKRLSRVFILEHVIETEVAAFVFPQSRLRILFERKPHVDTLQCGKTVKVG